MFKWIDNFLNRITMYRLVLYYLLVILGVAIILSFFGLTPYNPLAIFASALALTISCWITNYIFSFVFEAPTNVESVYITALILALIITPPLSFSDMRYLFLAGWASVLSMAVKYIFAINKKHLFNPAALAVVLTALVINQSANWWVGTANLMPVVLVGGFLLVRKLRRSDLVVSFLLTALVIAGVFSYLRGPDLLGNFTASMQRLALSSSLLFFAFVMLTEPLTSPPTRWGRIIYGVLIGIIFSPAINLHIGSLYSTPELALVLGNIFSYAISPKEKLRLKLKAVETVAKDTYDFVFAPDQPLKFQPGQYLEWTLPHKKSDSRGNRRYFTVASSPTEADIRMGVKFYSNSSSFKKTLAGLGTDDTIVASQLAGEFTLPKDKNKKLVFVAGGIGVTPYRSMIKYLLDKNEKRDIVILYSNQTAEDIAYADLFKQAETGLGIKTVYTLTNLEKIPADWQGRSGFINVEMVKAEIPDYQERLFYISGPQSIVTALSKTLRAMGIKRSNIKKDFFPGFV